MLLYFIKRVFYAIFSNLHIKYMFFTDKINFGNLGNFVIVGCDFSQVKLQLKMNYQLKKVPRFRMC
jgi:hypothetical protein